MILFSLLRRSFDGVGVVDDATVSYPYVSAVEMFDHLCVLLMEIMKAVPINLPNCEVRVTVEYGGRYGAG